MHKLKLSDAADQHRMDVLLLIEPGREFSHQNRHVAGWRRRIDDFAGHRVYDKVLHLPIFAWRGFAAANALHQTFMDFADHPFGDRRTAVRVVGDKFERLPVIQEFTHIINVFN